MRESGGLYGTGILFQEPNPTRSRPHDLVGLCKTTVDIYVYIEPN